MSYTHNKTWRLHNPQKRNAGKKEYYKKHREARENLMNSRQRWTLFDIERITAPVCPSDSVLAKEIGRSVQAIQAKRVTTR